MVTSENGYFLQEKGSTLIEGDSVLEHPVVGSGVVSTSYNFLIRVLSSPGSNTVKLQLGSGHFLDISEGKTFLFKISCK